jgi:hypothetical protein
MGGGELMFCPFSEPLSNANEMRACYFQIMAIDPSAYKTLNELLETETKGKGRLESLGTIGVTKEERLE